MCILSSPSTDHAASLEPTPTRLLPPTTRQQLVLDALAGQSISQLALQHHVSRKFIYQQLRQAQHALEQAFQTPADKQAQTLFWLPVTKLWLQQLVVGLRGRLERLWRHVSNVPANGKKAVDRHVANVPPQFLDGLSP